MSGPDCKLVCDGRDIYGMGRLRRLNTNPAIWGLLARFFRELQLVFVRQARSKGSLQAFGAMSWWIELGPQVPGA